MTDQQFKASIGAIDIRNKSKDEINLEFKENLGFDPSNLDELNKLLEHNKKGQEQENIENLLNMQKQMHIILQERFALNLEALKKYMPHLYTQFKNYQPTEPLEFICTSNGVPNLFYPQKNEFFYKTFDPLALCHKQVDVVLEHGNYLLAQQTIEKNLLNQIHYRYFNEIQQYQQNRHDFEQKLTPKDVLSIPSAILIGVGLGYHIGYLYSQIEIGNAIIIEPNQDVFFASLHTFDWHTLLPFIFDNQLGFSLIVGQSKAQIFNDLNLYYLKHGRVLAGFLWSITHYRSQEIDDIVQTIQNEFACICNNLSFIDDQIFGLSHSLNLLKNNTSFVKANLDLPKNIADIPVCVIGNGPSLSNDLNFLRQIQDKVIIIACGTALETLYNQGIKPHFYACTERLNYIAEVLELIPDKEFLSSCILLTSQVAHPAIFKYFKHALTFTKGESCLYTLLCKKRELIQNIQQIYYMNPLVGNLGLASALFLNFKNIYLFGIDNGSKQEEYLHPKENILYAVCKNTFNPHTLEYEVAGNFGGIVKSSQLFNMSNLMFELAIKICQQRGIFVFNCSDGAKITGATPTHSSTLLWWHNLNDVNTDELYDFFAQHKSIKLNLSEDEVNHLFNLAEYNDVVDSIIKELSKEKRPQSRLEYIALLQHICKIIYNLSQTKLLYVAKIIEGSIFSIAFSLLRSLYSIRDEKEAIKCTDECLKYLIYLLEDSKYIAKFIPNYCMGEHEKILNGFIGLDHDNCQAPPVIPFDNEIDAPKVIAKMQPKFIKRYQ